MHLPQESTSDPPCVWSTRLLSFSPGNQVDRGCDPSASIASQLRSISLICMSNLPMAQTYSFTQKYLAPRQRYCEEDILDRHPRTLSSMTGSPSVPGTIYLVDSEGVLRAKHASGGQQDVVLVPAPSDDPNDPLNWSSSRKNLSTACISMSVYHLSHD